MSPLGALLLTGCSQGLAGQISTLHISRTARIDIFGLDHTRSSHNTVAIFCTSPRRSLIDFYHPLRSPVLPTICTGPILTSILIILNPRPNERSRSYSPPGSRDRGPGPLLRKPKSSYFLSYKLDSLGSGRRSRLLVSSLIDSRSIGWTIALCLQPWT